MKYNMEYNMKHLIHILFKQNIHNCDDCVREIETDINYINSRRWRLKDMKHNKDYWSTTNEKI